MRVAVREEERDEQTGPEERQEDEDELERLKPHVSLTARSAAFFRSHGAQRGEGPRRERQGPTPHRPYGTSESKRGGDESTGEPPGLRSCGTPTVAVPSHVAPNWSVAVKCTT